MGASEFYDFGTGTDAKDAFSKVVEEAEYEHGHGGYSGTIAEKQSFKMMTSEVFSAEAAQKLAEDFMDADDKRIRDKWGPAGCIEVIYSSPSRERKFLFFGLASS